MGRVGQNRLYTPYMTVYLVISLPKIPYIHRIYMVLANPNHGPLCPGWERARIVGHSLKLPRIVGHSLKRLQQGYSNTGHFSSLWKHK